LITMKIRLQKIKKSQKKIRWNLANLKIPAFQKAYENRLDKQLNEDKIDGSMTVDEIWNKMKEGRGD